MFDIILHSNSILLIQYRLSLLNTIRMEVICSESK